MNFTTKQVKRNALYFAIACLSVALLWVAIKYRTRPPRVPEASYSVPRQIQYSFTLQNKTDHLVKKADFWTYAPVKQTATQRCNHIEASHPYRLISDDLGNQVLHFTLNNFPPYGTKIITINVALLLSDSPNDATLSDPKLYLQPEKYIESNNATLLRTAHKLSKEAPLKTAENIFNWVANNVKYSGYLSSDRGALYALSHKKGDCTEYMYLFTALCRANQIPSRCIGGYICRENTILKPSGYHNWSEFYDDSTWRVVDAQNKIFMKDPSRYIAMRVFGASLEDPAGTFHRFRFKGDGLKVRMNS